MNESFIYLFFPCKGEPQTAFGIKYQLAHLFVLFEW